MTPNDGNDQPSRLQQGQGRRRVKLKDLAEYVGLSPTTVSLVLNRSPAAQSIPPETHRRVLEAARELGYRPHHVARSLRSRRSQTVGVLVPEIFEPYAAGVMSGIEQYLIQEDYFYLVASHHSKADLLNECLELLESRLVEGVILVAATLSGSPGLPTVVVSGHERVDGVTNVVIDHDDAARQALSHLTELGHERIAFFKGQPGNADTEDRWRGILEVAGSLGIEVSEDLTLELRDDPTGKLSRTEQAYREGYAFGKELLRRRHAFTALFAFNDVSAIGASRAFLEAGLKVPEDISVVGFDDILSAAFHNPGLTTVRQPLRVMGETAGRILLDRISGAASHPDFVTVETELVVRGSTGPPPAHRQRVSAQS